MKQEEVATATQWHGKQVSKAMNQQATTEELLEVGVFCVDCSKAI
jgi:hypothetical protein